METNTDLSEHPEIGGLFDITTDCEVCITTAFCPCVTYGQSMNELIPTSFRSQDYTTKFALQYVFCCPLLPCISDRFISSRDRMTLICQWYLCNPCYLCKLRRTSRYIKQLMIDVVASNQLGNGSSEKQGDSIEAIEVEVTDEQGVQCAPVEVDIVR